MPASLHRLSFEKPIYEIEEQIAALEANNDQDPQRQDEIRQLRRKASDLKRSVFGSLDPWQTVEVARHPDRPMTSDYISLVFDEFVELHGDKNFGDDAAIRTGFAKLDQYKVLIVGQQKGKTLKERNACHFGMAHPEGYPQSDVENATGRQVRSAGDLHDRYARRVSRRRRRRARPKPGHCRKHVPDVAAAARRSFAS